MLMLKISLLRERKCVKFELAMGLDHRYLGQWFRPTPFIVSQAARAKFHPDIRFPRVSLIKTIKRTSGLSSLTWNVVLGGGIIIKFG